MRFPSRQLVCARSSFLSLISLPSAINDLPKGANTLKEAGLTPELCINPRACFLIVMCPDLNRAPPQVLALET